MIRVLLASVAVIGAISASAQTVNTVPGQATAPARTMPANTLITVTPVDEISSKRVKVGDKVRFATIGDTTENGVVVIARGAVVMGEITFKTGKAIGGKSGKFEVSFRTVTVGGVEYPLTGIHRQEGRGNTAAALLGSMLVSGRSAVMQPGQEARAFTAAPIPY